MFNKDNLTEEQKLARELRLQGKSRRQVAKELWEVSSRESTIRSWEDKGLLDVVLSERDSAIIKLHKQGMSSRKIAKEVIGRSSAKSTINDVIKRYYESTVQETSSSDSRHVPKVLVFDLETSPLKSYTWGLWQQNVGLNMIHGDWFLLSYAAKWLGDPEDEVMYGDLRGVVDQEDDDHLLREMWQLLDEADIVLTQNGIKFDVKKINARFILKGYQPPSSYKHIDTLKIAKKEFGFTSNKLEYMTDKLCTKYKKLKHSNFSGFELWAEMLKDNPTAWDECEVYNKYDVLSLEELYTKMAAWDSKHPNFNLYSEEEEVVCRCGSKDIKPYGYAYTAVSKFQRYRCSECGAESRGRKNLFTKEKRASLRMNVL